MIGPGADALSPAAARRRSSPSRFTTPLGGDHGRAGRASSVASTTARTRRAAAARAAPTWRSSSSPTQTEGVDGRCLTFECPPVYGDQDALIEAVAAANPRTAVVIESGGPVLTPWRDEVGAVLEAWYPGPEGGKRDRARAVRQGRARRAPAGDVPAKRDATCPPPATRRPTPASTRRLDYPEGLLVGYRHYDANGLPAAFPFGHGLSYTRFASAPERRARPRTRSRSTVRVKNTGDRARGRRTPALRRLPPTKAVPQPPRALKGFAKVEARARATAAGSPCELDRRALSYWDTRVRRVAGGRGLLRPPARGVLARHRPAGEGRLAGRLRHAPALTRLLPFGRSDGGHSALTERRRRATPWE